MARIYPDRIPECHRQDPGHSAECALYERLREQLSQDYVVFAWVSWVLRDRRGARDGEADFMVVHPQHGVLVIEVKGGGIRRDGASGRWFSIDRRDEAHALARSPFQQARENKYAIARKLEEVPAWKRRAYAAGHAVALPDVSEIKGDLGPEEPREAIIYREDLPDLAARIAEIYDFWAPQQADPRPLGGEGVELLRQTFAKDFELPLPLGRAIEEDARAIVRLTESQFTVLDGLARNPRVVVSGGAGTGKTLLALEKAKRLAREGCRTLLTCFNRGLAEYLLASAGGCPGLLVRNFHVLCEEFAGRAGVPLPDKEADENAYYREQLPEAFVAALEKLDERFDAIVVDEGQDFGPVDRAALQWALADRADAILYVFQDEAQGVYRDGSAWPLEGMRDYLLTENRRNTRAIHAVLETLVPIGTRPLGPPGSAPEFVRADGIEEERRALSKALHRLIHEERTVPGAIVVLTMSRGSIADIAPDGRIGAYEITDKHEPQPNRVLVESVARFKGLERDVVVLARLSPVGHLEFVPSLYVGASRARAHLVVVGSKEVLAHFGEKTKAGA